MDGPGAPRRVAGAAAPRRRRPTSLALRLTFWYAAAVGVLLIATTGYLYWTLAGSERRETFEFVGEEVRLLRSILARQPEPSEALRLEVEWEWSEPRAMPVYVRILDEEGHGLLETPGMGRVLPSHLFPAPIPADREPESLVDLKGSDGAPFRVLAARAVAGPGAGRTIQIAVDITGQERVLGRYRWRSRFLVGFALIASAVSGRRIAERGLRHVRKISDAARRVQAPALEHRIDATRLPAELAALAETINSMLDRLETSFTRQARFSADIAHEIRTPVNNIRGEAEVALARPRSAEEYREALGSCLEECSRLTRIIDTLLFLARAENAEEPVAREPVEVGETLAGVRDFYEAAAAEAGVTIRAVTDGRIERPLNRTLLQRALGNLVENALRHTPRGGTVTLSARRVPRATVIEVADDGSGIRPEHLPHLFERFYRADPSRAATAGASGLGLSIVKAIAELHGGAVAIESLPGAGTTVRLVLPDADDENLMRA